MLYETESDLTEAVCRSFEACDDPRLTEIMTGFVRALHDLVRTLQLSRSEIDDALDFLVAVGKSTTDTHNEAVLLADVLGLSTLAMLLEHKSVDVATAPALLGPFYRGNPPVVANGGSIIRCPTPGAPLLFEGQIVDGANMPIADVAIDIWQSSPLGLYDNQDPTMEPMNLRGRFRTDSEGRFSFRSVRPAGYPIPTHGPTGRLLELSHRTPMRPAHIHLLAYKLGYTTLITQYFLDDAHALESDAVFGARQSLVGKIEPAMLEPIDDNDHAATEGWRACGIFTLIAGEAQRPKPPIA